MCLSRDRRQAVFFSILILKFRFHELLRGDSLILMECFNKVTFVIKTTGNRGFLDGDVFRGQHFTGAFDTVIIQVIDGRAFRHAAEIAAEIFGIHSGDSGQAVQADAVIIIFRNISENVFNRIEMSCLFDVLYVFFIQMLFQNRADELVQITLGHKFIAGPFAG